MRFIRLLRPCAVVGAYVIALIVGGASPSLGVTGPTVSVDTNASGNGANAVGTIEPCSSIASTGTSFQLDIVIQGVTSLSGFEADLFYNNSTVSITGENGAMFLARGFFFDLSDPTPDIDGHYHMVIATSGYGSGDGVIVRLTLQGNANGISALSLANVKLKDSLNNVVQPADAQGFYTGPVNSGSIAIGVACGSDGDGDGVLDTDETACGGDPLSFDRRPERIDGAFAGVDDDGDVQVDEPLPPGAEDYDCDGDGYKGSAEAGTPLCGNGVNDDGAVFGGSDDGVVDDGCPGGPAQVGVFSEAQFNIGLVDQDPCGTNGWPSELVSGGVPDSTNRVNVLDLTSFLAPARRLDTSPGHPDYDKRWDLSPGRAVFTNWINVTDLTALISGPTGFPPMLGGERAFNGPACPWPP